MHSRKSRRLGGLAAASLLFAGLGIAPAAARADDFRPIANDCSAGYVTFTFDDGPDTNTPAVLNTLTGLNLKGVFFVLGSKLTSDPANAAIVAGAVAGGFSIQSHAFDHSSWTGASTGSDPLTEAQIINELDAASAAIVAAGAPKPTLYRPPYGDINAWADNIAEHRGYRIVMPWGTPGGNIVDSRDWTGISATQIAANVTNGYTANGNSYPGIRNESIVVMHDGEYDTTRNAIAALQPIVDYMNEHHLCSTSTIRDDATGGVVPPQASPPPATGNLVKNASLEQLRSTSATSEPACFQQSGADLANNVATWSTTADAHTGVVAERVDVTGWTAGDRKLVPSQRASEAATCVAPATPGIRYSAWVWYKGAWAFTGTTPTKVSIATYYRNAAGTWTYWASSPTYAPSSVWNLANYVTPPLPAGATAISFGLAINGKGTLITDDYTLLAK
ncbi:polysaccharide deacetylase family protein [Actinoplanes oblitus]|uniref:Polysaccharide deacetylase family protein n=1 Tax=Actinoplanes oblitus TaxID=3040509 RepID=A0ABY8WAV0_9ACTN|nr:polysaccharide deacetylase family protein [Actinoplanes oblitus]WIM94989.1 polysaccharide deacetylase family protein [Actinoplanes oblitus]